MSEELSREDQIAADKKKQAKKDKRSSRRNDKDLSLNINSMMDMMTIILCFLLKSVGAEPIQINQSDDLRLAFSSIEVPPQDELILTITKQYVMVDDEPVVPLTDGRIDPLELQSSESAIVPALQQKIEENLSELEQFASMVGREYQESVTIIADAQVPYRVLTQVMITASAANVQQFKFAVIQRAQGSGLAPASGE